MKRARVGPPVARPIPQICTPTDDIEIKSKQRISGNPARIATDVFIVLGGASDLSINNRQTCESSKFHLLSRGQILFPKDEYSGFSMEHEDMFVLALQRNSRPPDIPAAKFFPYIESLFGHLSLELLSRESSPAICATEIPTREKGNARPTDPASLPLANRPVIHERFLPRLCYVVHHDARKGPYP